MLDRGETIKSFAIVMAFGFPSRERHTGWAAKVAIIMFQLLNRQEHKLCDGQNQKIGCRSRASGW